MSGMLFIVLSIEITVQLVFNDSIVKQVVGQVLYPGRCKLLSPQQADPHVDIISLLGAWYQQGRIQNHFEKGDCSTTFYYIVDTEAGIVINRELVEDTIRVWNGTITRDYQYPQRFTITYDNAVFDFYVVATNYKEYALVYGCIDHRNDTKSVLGWLLSRNKHYVPTARAALVMKEALKLNPELNGTWIPIYHNKCNSEISLLNDLKTAVIKYDDQNKIERKPDFVKPTHTKSIDLNFFNPVIKKSVLFSKS